MAALTPRTAPTELAHGGGLQDYSAPIMKQKSLLWKDGAAEAIARDTSGAGKIAFELSRTGIFLRSMNRQTGRIVDQTGGRCYWALCQRILCLFGRQAARTCTDYRKETGTTSYLALFVDEAFLHRSSGLEQSKALQLRPTISRADLLSWQLALAIRDECEAGAPHGTLYAETAATMLGFQLLRHHSNLDQRKLKPARGGLAPYQLKRITEYIGDRLADELSLEELSSLIGLSPHNFCRAFKHSTGLPPHRWQISQQVKKAQALMLETTLSLADIALAAGFSDQSHLTTIFRKATGATPNAWRRATRS